MQSLSHLITDYESSESDGELTPRKSSLLRIDTEGDLRTNTPSPPTIPRKSPLRKIQTTPCIYSPRPESVLRLIKTPKRTIKNKIKLEHFELQNERVVDNLIQKVEIHNATHQSSKQIYTNRR